MTNAKRSRYLVDPGVLPALESMPSIVLNCEVLQELRARYPEFVEQFLQSGAVDLSGFTLTEHHIPGAQGDPNVRLLVLEPSDRSGNPRPAILDIHGGGHVMGTADGEIGPALNLCRELGAVAVLIDYRLSPETVFPGSLNDCYAALEWLVREAEELKIDRSRVAIFGGSAGGTLAVGLALLNRDRSNIPICHLHLNAPMLDDRTGTTGETSPYVGEYVWTVDCNAFGWSSLLGKPAGGDDVSPYAAPGRMEDLSGLPPTFISCGALDLFVEEGLEFARRLIRGGVATEIHIYPGLPHGLPAGTKSYSQEISARNDLAAWKRAMANPQGPKMATFGL